MRARWIRTVALSGLAAWPAMVIAMSALFGLRYLTGDLGDPDITGAFEASMIPVVIMTLPLGVLTFGVYVPSLLAFPARIVAKMPRLLFLVIGTMLAVPGFLMFVVIGDLLWPTRESMAQVFARILSHPNAPSLIATLAVGGLVMGTAIAIRLRTGLKPAVEA